MTYRHHDETPKRQLVCVDSVARRLLGGRQGPFLAQKSTFFYATPTPPPFFGLRRTRLNGIISPPYPEATFDTFGFAVGGRSAARRAVLWPQLPKVALFRVKNAVFWPETHFLETSSKKFVTIMTGHQKDNIFVLTALRGRILGGRQGPFWPKIGPKIRFFHATPI